MSKKKRMTENKLVDGLIPRKEHSDELVSMSPKEWITFGQGLDKADDDFLTEREDVFDLERGITVNSEHFINELKHELEKLAFHDLDLCDIGNEVGRVISKLTPLTKLDERELIAGIEHGLDLISKEEQPETRAELSRVDQENGRNDEKNE